MADPGTWALIGLAVSAVSTGLSAVSQYRQGKAQEKAYEYSAEVSKAEVEPKKTKAVYEETQSRQKLKRILGLQRALYAKAGVDITEGSPFLTMLSTVEEGEKEARMIRYGGEVDVAQSLNEARLQRMYGKSAGRAGLIGAGSTFLTGLGQAGLGYASYKSGLK